MYSVALGEGDEHQETAKGLTILKESAQGQIGVAWGAAQELIAGAIEQCIRLAASTPQEGQQIAVASLIRRHRASLKSPTSRRETGTSTGIRVIPIPKG